VKRGAGAQGERATNRIALVIKGKRRKSSGLAVKACGLTWGGLASRLKGRRRRAGARSQMWTTRCSQVFEQRLIRSLAFICPTCCCARMNAGQDGFCNSNSKQLSDLW
jgi:hypothetical protein